MSSPITGAAKHDPFLVYANFSKRIKLNYPADWKTQEREDTTAFLVVFVSAAEGPSDPFLENLSVIIEDLPQIVTLDAYVEFNLAQMRQFPIQLLESARSTLGGIMAQRVLFSGPLPLPMGPFQGKYLSYSALRGKRSYTATFTAQANKYEKFLPTVERMISSIEIS
jgi:serine/threonine-protein kinase